MGPSVGVCRLQVEFLQAVRHRAWKQSNGERPQEATSGGKNDDGRMPLADHLREPRYRLIV
jgi:hypothetical protein